jgi:nuclear pore complex protein Nup155
VVNESDDEVFHFNLYEWYIEQGWTDKLLAVRSQFIIPYLSKSARDNARSADLLWKFYVHNEQFFNAADILLDLAKSTFTIPLSKRIEYLSRAKANASAQSGGGVGRQQRQVLLFEVTELLEIANIQDEILIRIRSEPGDRIAEDRRQALLQALDGSILSCNDVSTYLNPLQQIF